MGADAARGDGSSAAGAYYTIQLYQSKVGAILWSGMGSRPEVQFATNTHARYTKSHLRGDMNTFDRVLEYLVHSPELGLVLGGTVDASYGTHADRKSHSGCTLPGLQ